MTQVNRPALRCVPRCLVALAVICLGGCHIFLRSEHPIILYTKLVASADACDLAGVQAAVEHDPKVVKGVEWDRATLLHDAVGHNCDELAAYLLDKGANPNAAKTDGVTPLHLAAQRGGLPVVTLLLEHGARTDVRDAKGWTPIDHAIKWGHPDIAAYLRQHQTR